MDAFAVSICKGLSAKEAGVKHYLVVGLWFGGFQMLMPAIGYFLGSFFAEYIAAFDHWVAFAILALIGVNMIREAFSKEEEKTDLSLSFTNMLLLAVATSIDALAVGIAFSFELKTGEMFGAVGIIGATTFLLSMGGVVVGRMFGAKFKSKAEIFGGVILILIGLKILLEGLGII